MGFHPVVDSEKGGLRRRIIMSCQRNKVRYHNCSSDNITVNYNYFRGVEQVTSIALTRTLGE